MQLVFLFLLADMAALRALLIFVGLTGIHSISTVSKVSVKTGGSISVPCSYESKYTSHVKYLCQGFRWASCEYRVKTNQPRGSGRYSISDDKQKKIFTVTIDPVTNSDSYYWCNVEINNAVDDGRRFQLSVTKGRPQLSVDHQKVTGFIGEDVTIRFTNSIKRAIQWCTLGGSCVREPGGSIDGTRVTIKVIRPDTFTVTLSGLRTEGDSWYYCAHDDVQMPVHVTVKKKPTTTTVLTTKEATTQLKTISNTLQPTHHTTTFSNSTTPNQGQRNAENLVILIISASVLIFIVFAGLLFLFILRQRKLKIAQTSAATEEDVQWSKAEEDVTYSVVSHRRPKGRKQDPAQDEDVIYSTLAPH